MGLLSSIFGGGGSQSTTVQNQTTITVTPQFENNITVQNDDSRLQQILDRLAGGLENTQQAALATAAVTAVAADKQIETAAAQAQQQADAQLKAAMIMGAATLASVFLPKLIKV